MSSDVLIRWLPLLGNGMLATLLIWLCATAITLVLGAAMGVLRSNRLRMRYVSTVLDWLTFVIRGIPFYVQLLLAYFVLPEMVGINLSPKAAGILSLGLCSAAYVSQIVRGGINSIGDEQWDACKVLGLNRCATIWYIMLPQAMRTIMPMLCGELDQLLKSTSIISAIGVLELTRAGLNIIASDMQIAATYGSIALLYLMLSSLLNGIFILLERRMAYDLR